MSPGRTSERVAALGLFGVMGGALITETFIVDGSLVAPLICLICATIIAWFRRDHTLALIRQLRALPSPIGS
ncbi:hypothetical protein [Streptomyces phaeochromogenes]|uniref:hypothetical protein n=1 Tax=Streptomyces phaeochromogenes TaxID=1923 RepID=UPI00369623F9